MKKIIFLLFICIPAALYSEDAREQRWISRLEKLQNYKIEMNSGPEYDKAAVSLIDEEIKSAEEFLSVLKKYKTGDDSVKSENRKYSIGEIETIAPEIIEPVISVYYISELVRNYGDKTLHETIKDEINRYALSAGFPPMKKDSRSADITSRSYILEKFSAEYESLKKKLRSDILSDAQYELSRNGYNSNEIDIKEKIAASALKLCSTGITKNSVFNPEYLKDLPEWKGHIAASSAAEKRTGAALLFAGSRGIALTPDESRRGMQFIENRIFFDDRSILMTMTENTVKSESAGHNNPAYEIPDFKDIRTAVEDIDKYRKALITSMNGTEDADFITRVRNNNRGISGKYTARFENFFKREKLRIARLKQTGAKGIIYNEEVFNTSEKHFSDIKEKLTAYAELSSGYLESLYSSWKTDPGEFISSYSSRTVKHIDYIAFMEKLTDDAVQSAKISDAKINNLYRAAARELFTLMKSLSIPEAIPSEVRRTMKKEQITGYSGINENLRVKGNELTISARKNFETYTSLYAETVSSRKSGIINSETSIGQDEVDRLISCAKKYSAAVASMKATADALKKYSQRYSEISDEISGGGDPSAYLGQINSGTIIPLIPEFIPEKIDREMKTRDLIVKEGNDSLSGAVALAQYYARRGFRINFVYTSEEIKKIRENFTTLPETSILSWRMNGRNYRLVDANAAENLKKIINKKAWGNSSLTSLKTTKEKFSADGVFDFSLSLPEGWQKSEKKDDTGASVSVELRSPDMLGSIIVRAVKYDKGDIQAYTEDWIKSGGFTPVSKNWSKIKGSDYLMTVSRNRYSSIMDSYIFMKSGYIVLISGTAEKKRYTSLNKNLKEIFSTLEI